MWLCRAIVDLDGETHRMAAVVPATATMGPTRAAVGYVEMEALRDTPVVARGTILRGHEFRFSYVDRVENPIFRSCLDDRCEGFGTEALHASYVHLDLGTTPAAVRRFLAAARAWGPLSILS